MSGEPPHDEGLSPISPYVVAMLMCDQVITDAESGKKTLVGVFHDVVTPALPVNLPLVTISDR